MAPPPKKPPPSQFAFSQSNTPTGTQTPSTPLAEEFNYADAPRPFKNPSWKGAAALAGIGGKRNKTLKQVLMGERERMRGGEEGERANYFSVEAPPSLLPAKKYCDVTGLEAPYLDPRSRLRYHNAEIYDVIKTFQPSVIQNYLQLRGSGTIIK